MSLLLSACQSANGDRVAFQRIEIDAMTAPGSRIELVDVGGDQAPDVVLMTPRPGRVRWYENPSWTVRQIPVIADELQGMAVLPQADAGAALALNGRFSMPGAGTRQQLIWLDNPGRQLPDQAWPVSVLQMDNAPGMLFAADMSGAGQMLLGSLPGLDVYVRSVQRSRWVSMRLIGSSPGDIRVRVFDWDANGRDDLLLLTGQGLDILALASRSRFVDQLRLLSVDNNQGFLDVGVGQSGHPARRFIATISVDGRRMEVFRPDPQTGRRWTPEIIADDLSGARVLKVADLNRNSFDEIIVGSDDGLLVYYYDVDEALWRRSVIDGSAVADVAVADMNGSGLPDIVTTPGEAGAVKLFQNRGRSN